jgi:hypothetical protein
MKKNSIQLKNLSIYKNSLFGTIDFEVNHQGSTNTSSPKSISKDKVSTKRREPLPSLKKRRANSIV